MSTGVFPLPWHAAAVFRTVRPRADLKYSCIAIKCDYTFTNLKAEHVPNGSYKAVPVHAPCVAEVQLYLQERNFLRHTIKQFLKP